jgi:hypothetical protein
MNVKYMMCVHTLYVRKFGRRERREKRRKKLKVRPEYHTKILTQFVFKFFLHSGVELSILLCVQHFKSILQRHS